ncbi:MAG: hypothetical protein KIT07_06175 [Anaerolineales bacterium]|nr:hypothetical protein [Anaerolineales bacterium]
MPGLAHSLEGQDFAYLRSVADLWRIELDAPDRRAAAQQLASQIQQLLADREALPGPCQAALQALAALGGRMPWPQFIRSYGPLREMGAARLEKERPQRQPVSVAEELWYRALVARAFFATPAGPAEFAYLPDEVLATQPAAGQRPATLGRPARPDERAELRLGSDVIVDQICSLLAANRSQLPLAQAAELEGWPADTGFLLALAQAAGLLEPGGKINASAARRWLEQERRAAWLALVQAALASEQLNELRLLPGLSAEGGWANQPQLTRQRVLELLPNHLPAGPWWSLSAFVADVKKHHPDFQRSAGEYDAWYLRNPAGEYLRGFAHWDDVEGALLHYMLSGPLHWLGLLDLAAPNAGAAPLAFRWSAAAPDLLSGRPPALPAEADVLKIDSMGTISASPQVPRAIRYQLARFCSWQPRRKQVYRYQISARGLQAARQQGLQASQLLALLKAQVDKALPPNVGQALQRWEQYGVQAQLAPQLVLRLPSAAALKALRASRAARWLGELLGPLAITVQPGAGHQVIQVLLELGYLGELEERE